MYYVDPSSGLHCHFALKKKFCYYLRIPQIRGLSRGSSSKFVSGFDSMTNLLHLKQTGNLGSTSSTTIFFPGLRQGLEESSQVLEPTVDERELASFS